MQIICPNCDFSAQIDLGTLPPNAAIANCPRCKHRFRFRSFDDYNNEQRDGEQQYPEQQYAEQQYAEQQYAEQRNNNEQHSDENNSGQGYNYNQQQNPIDQSPKEQNPAGQNDFNAPNNIQNSEYYGEPEYHGEVEQLPTQPPMQAPTPSTKQSPIQLPVSTRKQPVVQLLEDPEPQDYEQDYQQPKQEQHYGQPTQYKPNDAKPELRKPHSDNIWDELDAEHGVSLNEQEPQKKVDKEAANKAYEQWRSQVPDPKPKASSPWEQRLGLTGLDYKEVPWEHPKKYGYPNGFFETCKRILCTPSKFFSQIVSIDSIWPKLVFACFWKFFDLILTFLYHPTIVKSFMERSSLASTSPDMKMIMVIFSSIVITILLIALLSLFALVLKTCANIVVPGKTNFNKALAVVCYPNAILILAIIPFEWAIVPAFFVTMVFNCIAIHRGLHLSSMEFVKVALMLVLCSIVLLASVEFLFKIF